MSTNVKRATRKGLLPDYYSILATIFNIIHVFFSKTFFVHFCFPSNMAAKYAVDPGYTVPDRHGHDFKLSGFTTSVALKFLIILRNLITTNHRKKTG